MKLLYIAGPYRASTIKARDIHIAQAEAAGMMLLKRKNGWFPMIPHTNTGRFEDAIPEVGDDVYLQGTLEMMRRSDAVLLLNGYEHSSGTAGEISEAKRLGLPIYKSLIEVPHADQVVPPIPPETVAVPRKPDPLEDEPE